MKVLQGNLHRSRTADALLDQMRLEVGVDLLIISEQYRNRNEPQWHSDNLGVAAIWTPNPSLVGRHGAEDGFVWVECKNITYVSCYFTPNESIHEFRRKIDNLEDKIRELQGAFIVAGDFNAKALEWGMNTTNTRGRYILEMTARTRLSVVNEGNVSTFRRPGYSETIPDITLASDAITPKIAGWRVMENYTGSDHQYITFNVRDWHRQPSCRPKRVTGWNVAKLDTEKLMGSISSGIQEVLCHTGSAEEVAEVTMKLVHQACNASMPKRRALRGNKTAAYWWTDEIANLRSRCLHLRRSVTRARRRTGYVATLEHEQYSLARRILKMEINKSKRLKWNDLKRDVDTDPWGLGYRVVMRKLGSQMTSPVMKTDEMKRIVDSLFPLQDGERTQSGSYQPADVPMFTEEELQEAVGSLQSRKAPGPDGVPVEVLKAISQSHPGLLLKTYNRCLEEGVFPRRWKKQRLVLISKGKGDQNSAAGYRPLCMLDAPGKLLERLIKPRLTAAIQEAGDLSDRQYGFRKGRSTIGAVAEVVRVFQRAQLGNHHSRKIVLLVTLDVRNAFNSARWTDMLEAMENVFHIPEYLMQMMDSYLKDRILIYETADGTYNKKITGGAAQGSILGPDLWNISYDGILRMEMPEETFLVGYADDIAAVIVARDTEQAQRRLSQVMRRTNSWLCQHGLSLATEKTEVVLLTRRRMVTDVTLYVGSEPILSKTVIKYLGVRLDTKLTFWEQVRYASEKATKVSMALSRLMTNVGGPSAEKRRLLMAVTNSILLYGCEIWAASLKKECRRKQMAAVQRRGALRIASSYRTVSEPAILVIAGVMPIDLMAEERKRIYDTKDTLGVALARQAAREYAMQSWQDRWEGELRGRWTAKLIKNLAEWQERKYGEVNYYITQFLTGHGYFCAYLHKIQKVQDSSCIYGDSAFDDVEHTFSKCGRWQSQRVELQRKIGIGSLTADGLVKAMLTDRLLWDYVATYIENVLKKKKPELDQYLQN